MLEFRDYGGSFVVEKDAGNTSLGAVLSNVIHGIERTLVFASRMLSTTEKNYSTTKREAPAVVQAVKWFKSDIWGVKFVLRTDHSSLQWLFKQKDPYGMTFRMQQQRNGNADDLSRMWEGFRVRGKRRFDHARSQCLLRKPCEGSPGSNRRQSRPWTTGKKRMGTR